MHAQELRSRLRASTEDRFLASLVRKTFLYFLRASKMLWLQIHGAKATLRNVFPAKFWNSRIDNLCELYSGRSWLILDREAFDSLQNLNVTTPQSKTSVSCCEDFRPPEEQTKCLPIGSGTLREQAQKSGLKPSQVIMHNLINLNFLLEELEAHLNGF